LSSVKVNSQIMLRILNPEGSPQLIGSRDRHQMPTKLVGDCFQTPAPVVPQVSEKFACRTGKCNRKWLFLTPLKAAVYTASLPRPCSAPPPSNRNGIGLQEVTRLGGEGPRKEVNLFKKSNVSIISRFFGEIKAPKRTLIGGGTFPGCSRMGTD